MISKSSWYLYSFILSRAGLIDCHTCILDLTPFATANLILLVTAPDPASSPTSVPPLQSVLMPTDFSLNLVPGLSYDSSLPHSSQPWYCSRHVKWVTPWPNDFSGSWAPIRRLCPIPAFLQHSPFSILFASPVLHRTKVSVPFLPNALPQTAPCLSSQGHSTLLLET